MESANLSGLDTVLLENEVLRSQFSPENVELNIEGLPVAFPSDQERTIQNINTLITEVSSLLGKLAAYLLHQVFPCLLRIEDPEFLFWRSKETIEFFNCSWHWRKIS